MGSLRWRLARLIAPVPITEDHHFSHIRLWHEGEGWAAVFPVATISLTITNDLAALATYPPALSRRRGSFSGTIGAVRRG